MNYFPTDRFMTNYLSVNIFLPLEDRSCAENAIAFKCLKYGSRALPTRTAIQEKAQDAYDATLTMGGISKKGDIQQITSRLITLDDAVLPAGSGVNDTATSLFADVLLDPLSDENGFSEQYTDETRNEIFDKIKVMESSKSYFAEKRCCQEMFRNELSGIEQHGSNTALKAVTPKSAFDAYRKTLSEAPIEIYYCGRGNIDKIVRTFEPRLSSLRKDVHSFPATAVKYSSDFVREVRETDNINQSHLVIGFRLGATEQDGNRPVLLMLNELYGHGTLSKLFMNVREKESLCYAISSRMSILKGTMIVSCGINRSRKDEAQEGIFHQLDEIRNGHITASELEAAKRSLRSAFLQVHDSPEAPARWYLDRMLAGRVASPEEEYESVATLTIEEIANAARRITGDTIYFLEGTLDSGECSDESEAPSDA